MGTSPEELQRRFYTETATRYDEMHVAEDDPHAVALDFVSGMIDGYGYESVLDVGAGTGRALRHFLDRHSGIEAHGVEPVPAMIEQAGKRNGIPEGMIEEAGGGDLPIANDAFDAVCEFGVLHHVADPDAIVAEMIRVARRAVFLSDNNRFANGGPMHRAAKYLLHRIGLWPAVYRAATRGRGYHLSPLDGGVTYSYSVYDSLPLLNEWADRVLMLPTVPVRSSWFHPLFSAPTVLICAFRD